MKSIYPAKRYQDLKVLMNIFQGEGEGGVVRSGMMVLGTEQFHTTFCCTISMFPCVPVLTFYNLIVLISSHSMWHITTTILLSFPSC